MPRYFTLLAAGVAMLITARAGAATTFHTVHHFSGTGEQGIKPAATLSIGLDRRLYGTTTEGGENNAGTAFHYDPAGQFTVLDSFATATTGRASVARLVSMPDGFLYGATSLGTGTAGQPIGTVFRLSPSGGAGSITPLFSVPGFSSDPKIPVSLVSVEPNVIHVLCSSPGGIWRVPLNGDPATVSFSFPTSGDSGLFPSRIIGGLAGAIYGVTTGNTFVGTTPGRRGTVFRIAANGSGFTTLHDFELTTGVAPIGALVQDGQGNLYGTTSAGGTNLDGVIFEISAAGVYRVLRHLADQPSTGDLLLASDGKLYGVSERGGTGLYGSVFRINKDGSGFQVLHSFNKTNGAFPKCGLVQGDDGFLYGVTSEGGTSDRGTIFRIGVGLGAATVNRPPVANEDDAFSDGSAVNINVLANDFDADGDALTVTIEQQAGDGSAVVQGDGTITYSPSVTYSGNDEFRYRITDPSGRFDIAEVEISDAPVASTLQPGVYNGLLHVDTALTGAQELPRGQIVLNVSPLGVVTGKLFSEGKRASVRGILTDENTAIATVKLPRLGRAILFLVGIDGRFVNVVILGKEIWSGSLDQLAAPAGVVDAPAYTAAVIGDSLQPGSYGFATMKFLSNGLVAAVGKMPDGTNLALGSTLVGQGNDLEIPYYFVPRKGGYFAGRLAGLASMDGYRFVGAGRWFRAPGGRLTEPFSAGFMEVGLWQAEPYVLPARGQFPLTFSSDAMGTLALGQTTFNSDTTFSATVSKGTLARSPQLKSFTVSRSTGLFSGKAQVTTPAGPKTVPIRGAFLQLENAAYGQFFINKVPGFVVLAD